MTQQNSKTTNQRLEEIIEQYPALGTPGILSKRESEEDADELISPPTLIRLFDAPVRFSDDRGLLFHSIATNLIKVNLKSNVTGVEPLERIAIINAHYDLAIVMLQEGQRDGLSFQAGHKKCRQSINPFEKERISALERVMSHPRANAEVWGEYATWLHDNLERLGDYISQADAEHWYKKAAQADNTHAMNGLGVLYYSTAQDYDAKLQDAINLWQQSAGKGNVLAAENLIEAILNGDDADVPKEVRQRTIKAVWDCAAHNLESGLADKMEERRLYAPAGISEPCFA